MQTLANLDRRLIRVLSDKIVFTIRESLKTTRPGKDLGPTEILALTQDPRICPVAHIKHYLATTQTPCQVITLLVSYTKPHKAVTNSTTVQWVKSTLKDAGIVVSTFSAHSSRTAALSYGLSSDLPLQDVRMVKCRGFCWALLQTS